MYDTIERIDVLNTFDWHERKQLMKIAFPFDIHTDKAVFDIQFGNVERTISSNTSWDRAKFEVCGHKWVDLSEYGYGVSLLNNCKYGFSVDDGVLKLTALKCGTYPNEEADQGLHQFTYSIYPHIGDFRDGETVRAAYSLNQPLEAAEIKNNCGGTLPAEYSLIRCDSKNIVIDTLKQCEDSEDYIIRLYDSFNCRSEVNIDFGLPIKSAEICDLMENSIEKLKVNNNSVKVLVGNFEIVTLKVAFK
jgi:alpha-mannosidase